MQKLKYFIQESWLLIVSALAFGLLLAIINAVLAGPIEQQRINKLNRLASKLLPDAENFEPIDPIEILSPKGKPEKIEAYKATRGGQIVGWSFNIVGSGFADKIALVVGVDRDCTKMAGYDVLSSNETPGFGDKIKNAYYRDQFKGAPVGELTLKKTGDPKKIDDEIIAITGATISSEAVVDILGNAMTQIRDKMAEKGLIKAPPKKDTAAGSSDKTPANGS